MAGPECTPPPSRDQRAALRFDPFSFREPLQALQQIAATEVINHYYCLKWDRESTYLLERLDQYLKDSEAWKKNPNSSQTLPKRECAPDTSSMSEHTGT